MKNFSMKVLVVAIAIMVVFSMVGCKNESNKESVSDNVTISNEITIAGLGEDLVLNLEQIKNFKQTETKVKVIDTEDKVKEYAVKGVRLDDILGNHNKSQKDFQAVRLTAGDGYAIEVPKDVIDKRDLILAYEVDGKPLDDKSKPLRVMLTDERSMYCLRNLSKVELIKEERSNKVSKVVLFQAAIKELDKVDIVYYGKNEKAVNISDIFEKYRLEKSKGKAINIVSKDGLKKTEEYDVFTGGYLKTTGDECPVFMSPDIPKGMFIKSIFTFSYLDTAFYNVDALNSEKEILLKEILKQVGLSDADKLKVTCEDGYNKVITSDMFDKGYIYEKEGSYRLAFKEMPKDTKIKYVLSLEIAK